MKQSTAVRWYEWTSLTDKLDERPDVWFRASLGLQALWTRGPSVMKRIGPRNRGFPLSSLYLCRITFRVIKDALAFLVMLYVCCFWARRILSCSERYSVHSEGDIGRKKGSGSCVFVKRCWRGGPCFDFLGSQQHFCLFWEVLRARLAEVQPN